MCKGHSVASILLPCSIGLALATIISCFFWANANGHLNLSANHYPFVSQMGDLPPEHYLFAVGFGVSAVLLALATGIRFMQFRWALDWIDPDRTSYPYSRACNIVLLAVNVFASCNLIVLASFGLSEYHIAHYVGAALFFTGNAIYQIGHTAYSAYMSRLITRNKLISIESLYQPSTTNMLIWYLVWNIVMVIAIILGLALFRAVGIHATAACQHVLILSVLMYYLPWFYELKAAHLDTLERVNDLADDRD